MTTKRTFFSLRKLTIGLVPVTFAVLATVHTKHVRADTQDEPEVANIIKEEALPTETSSNGETTNETNIQSNAEPTEGVENTTSVENTSVSTSTTESSTKSSEETVTTADSTLSTVDTKPTTNEIAVKEDVIDWNKVIYEVGDDKNVAITDYTYEAADLEKEWTVLLPNTYDFIQKGIIDEDHIATISPNTLYKIAIDRSKFIPGTDKVADSITIKISENGESKLKASEGDWRNAFPSYGESNLTHLDLSNLDTSAITSLQNTFSGLTKLETLDIADWDVSNVTSLMGTFSNTKSLKELDLSKWDTHNVTTIRGWFWDSGIEKLYLKNWDTSKMFSSYMGFFKARNLTHLDLSDWHGGGPNDISLMFVYLDNLKYLNISNWDWVRNFSEIEDRNVLQTSPNLEVLIAKDFKNLPWHSFYHLFVNLDWWRNSQPYELINGYYYKYSEEHNVPDWIRDPSTAPPIEEASEADKELWYMMRNYFAFQSNHPLIIIAPDDFGDRSSWSDDSNPDLKRPTEINLNVNFVAEGTSQSMKADLENFMFPSIDDLNATIDQKIRAAVGEKVDLTKYDLTYEIPVTDEEIEKDPATLIRKLTRTYQVELTHKIAQSTESKTVKRTITVITPNEGTKEITQEVVFTRNVSTDLVTEQSTYTDFVSQDGNILATLGEYLPAAIPGYTPSIPKVDALEVNADSTPEDITITYKKVATNTSIDENKPTPTPIEETPTTGPTSDTPPTETTETTEEKLTISDDNNQPETETETSEEKLVIKQSKQSKAKVNKINQLVNKVQAKPTEIKATLPQTGEKQTALFVGISVLLASLGLFATSKKKTEE